MSHASKIMQSYIGSRLNANEMAVQIRRSLLVADYAREYATDRSGWVETITMGDGSTITLSCESDPDKF